MSKKKSFKNILIWPFKGLIKLVGLFFYYLGLGFGKGFYYTLIGFYEFFKLIFNGIKNSFSFLNKTEKKAQEEIKTSIEDIKKGKLNLLPDYKNLEELKNIKGNLQSFIDKLNMPGKIGIILGARGTGKSALGMRILENVHSQTKKPVYAMGFREDKLPVWINVVNSIEDVENNSLLLVDESGITFSSREAMSNANKLLSELLLIARHKDISILFITQNSSNIEINTLRQADFLLLKPSSLLQMDFERKSIKNIYESVSDMFEELDKELGLTYIYSSKYRGFVKNTLPSFWSQDLSKSFSQS
jgi:replicative DNA helicase